MSRKAVIDGLKIFNAQSIASTTITSATVYVLQTDSISVHFKANSTLDADATIRVYAKNGDNDSWAELTNGFSSAPKIANGDTESLVLLEQVPFSQIYFTVTSASATARTVTAVLTSKSVGA